MRTYFVFLLLCPLLVNPLFAAQRNFQVVTNTAVLNHWPGPDGFIGTADDIVSGMLSPGGKSSPNSFATYSFIVTSLHLFGNQPDSFLFGSWDTATFVIGSMTVDPNAFLTNDIPMLTSLEFQGTELFPFHGAYSVRFKNPRDGQYTRQGNVLTFSNRYDFEGTFVAGFAQATNATANGVFAIVNKADFAAPDLTAASPALANYVRTVAIPLAQQQGATALLCGNVNLATAGAVPGTPGYFPPLNAYAVGLALELPSTTGELRVSIEVVPEGIRIRWNPLPGKTYTVETTDLLGGTFKTATSGQSATEYLDTNSAAAARFYRIRVD